MSPLIKPRNPLGSEPSRDDDPTGVRALLSAMPEPDPMPQYLVERINASLAAEQAQRSAKPQSASVTPLLAAARRRPRRLVFALAAAAAVALVAVAGDNLLTAGQSTSTSAGAALVRTSSAAEPRSEAAQKDAAKAPAVAGAATTPSEMQIGQSGTRYTQSDFVTQAQILRMEPPRTAAITSTVGPAGTSRGLAECLSAIGVSGAEVLRADVASYQGQPAVIIITITNGVPLAYAVGPRCSHADPAVLRPATPLP